jgi:hypothetical protein
VEEAIEEGKDRHWAVVPSKRKKEEEKNFLCKKKRKKKRRKYSTERRGRGRRKRYFIAQLLNSRLSASYIFLSICLL